MNAVLHFIFSALRTGVAYIDVDGCVLKKFPVPCYVPIHARLEWWRAHLQPTAVVRSRVVLLYVLRALGVHLVLWTNRAPEHFDVTRKALGKHWKLFRRFRFCDGRKEDDSLSGPVMDDDQKYVDLGVGYSLLVETR